MFPVLNIQDNGHGHFDVKVATARCRYATGRFFACDGEQDAAQGRR